MMYKRFSTFILSSFLVTFVHAQFKESNSLFSFLNKEGKKVFILGEIHSSAANPEILKDLLERTSQSNESVNLFLEIGPSEAFLYNRFLASGDTTLIDQTVYAGNFKEWRNFWRNLYSDSIRSKLTIRGFDFDRPAVFKYILTQVIADNYPDLGPHLNDITELLSDPDFDTRHSSPFPNKEDKEFYIAITDIFYQKRTLLEQHLPKDISQLLQNLAENEVLQFGGNRDESIQKNIMRYVSSSSVESNVVLMGRGHADLSNNLAAKMIKKRAVFAVSVGLILYHNSQILDSQYEKVEDINELNKKPWKKFTGLMPSEHEYTYFHTVGNLQQLDKYADFIIIASNQRPLTWINL
ncbi:MAG: hypothetical protein AAF519_09495 [Bacteroidota bacterium]